MSAVRDSGFWKRFSIAVHQDEEAVVDEKGLKASDEWLVHTRKKNRGSYACFCYLFWVLLAAFITAIVIVIIVLIHNGIFAKIHIGNSKSSS